MKKKISQQIVCISLSVFLGCGSLCAEEGERSDQPGAIVVTEQLESSDTVVAPDIIFSNLGPAALGRYYTKFDHSLPVNGKRAGGETESWEAVRFTPRVDTQAKVLAAAIGYISGTKRVNLGIYSDEDGTVGTVLPGGEGSTIRIPDIGECCQLAKVILAGEGVALTADTDYWLVASPDNVNAPDFEGGWQESNRAISANMTPPLPWRLPSGAWPAAQVRGTNLPTGDSSVTAGVGLASSVGANVTTTSVVIYKNFGPPTQRYFTAGVLVAGRDAAFQPEAWEALPFIPKADVYATTLAAAIGYVSGTKLVNLGIYSDNDGSVGTPLPGGQGSTTDIPDADQCCDLAKITLAGPGVVLKAGTQYWLVASPDNERAPDFLGHWQVSSVALGAYQQPELFINWTNESGLLLAAEIRGTLP